MSETKFNALSDVKIKTLVCKSGTHIRTFLTLFSQTQKYFEFYRVCVQLETSFLTNTRILWILQNTYLYTSPKLTVYNGGLSKICHVFVSMQPSSSTGSHVSSNNSVILSIYTSFDCLENKHFGDSEFH